MTQGTQEFWEGTCKMHRSWGERAKVNDRARKKADNVWTSVKKITSWQESERVYVLGDEQNEQIKGGNSWPHSLTRRKRMRHRMVADRPGLPHAACSHGPGL